LSTDTNIHFLNRFMILDRSQARHLVFID